MVETFFYDGILKEEKKDIWCIYWKYLEFWNFEKEKKCIYLKKMRVMKDGNFWILMLLIVLDLTALIPCYNAKCKNDLRWIDDLTWLIECDITVYKICRLEWQIWMNTWIQIVYQYRFLEWLRDDDGGVLKDLQDWCKSRRNNDSMKMKFTTIYLYDSVEQ